MCRRLSIAPVLISSAGRVSRFSRHSRRHYLKQASEAPFSRLTSHRWPDIPARRCIISRTACKDPVFVDAILDTCLANGVRLIVPTIDTELPICAKYATDLLSTES
jgi:hypothetical protein